MEVAFLILGFLLGVILTWFFFSKKIEVVNNKYNQERINKIKLETENENFRNNQELFEQQISQNIEFNVMKSMQINNENFINLARQTLDKYFLQAENGFQNKTHEIEKIIQPLQKSLDVYDKKLSDFENNTSQNLGNIKTYLSELSKMQNELTKQTNSLVGALKSPRIRGRWGEIGLRRIVEYSGLNEYCDFTEQAQSETSRQRPDLIINLPEKRQIIVDSKLPLEAYLDANETDNPNEQNLLLKKHLAAVKTNLKRLSAKDYGSGFVESIDFVVMYIEIEPALTAALVQDHNLINEALQHNIIIATPTTFIALLQTVAYGWRQYQMSENAQQILKEAKDFFSRTIIFTEHFEKLGKTINGLVDNFNQTSGSWNRRVEPSLRRIEELGLKDNKKSIRDINKINKIAKDV